MAFEEAVFTLVFSFAVFGLWQIWERAGSVGTSFCEDKRNLLADAICLRASDWMLFFVLVCVVMLTSIEVSKFLQNVFGKESPNAIFVYAICFQCLILLGIAIFKKLSVNFRFGFKLNAGILFRTVKYFFSLLLIVMGIGFLMNFLIFQLTGTFPEKQDIIGFFNKAENPYIIGIAVFSFLVLAPIAEELLFRCILYRSLKGLFLQSINVNYSRVFAAGVSSILFALSHGNVFAIAPLFAFALILTTLYERTGSIIATMFCHSGFNLFNVIFIVLVNEYI